MPVTRCRSFGEGIYPPHAARSEIEDDRRKPTGLARRVPSQRRVRQHAGRPGRQRPRLLMLLVHDYRSGLGFLVVQQMRFLVLAGEEQGRDDSHTDEREGHPVCVGERVSGLG
jgi:hypothetical protein